jgi:NAD(P)-dependent dehydrogenase (short-subunit alcohol dehydrogenase family)
MSQLLPDTRPLGAESSWRDVIAGADLSGRLYMVTGGGGAGLGFETTLALAKAKARVMIATRDGARGETAAAAVRAQAGSDSVEVGVVDLSSLASIRRFTDGFLAQGQSIDGLVGSAAMAFVSPRQLTEDGFEMQFGTNFLGHFALIDGLLPALKAGGGARVALLTSGAHRLSDVLWNDVNFDRRPYDDMISYGQSKTAATLLAVALNGRYAGDGVYANAVDPGSSPTPLSSHVPMEVQIARGWIEADGSRPDFFHTVEQGAATQVWAMVSPQLEERGGLFLKDCAIAGADAYMPYAMDPVAADRLWSMAEGWLSGSRT